MSFWGGSGSRSADPCLWLMDPDPDPGSGSFFFRHCLRCQQKTDFFNTIFSADHFMKLHLHHFPKIKIQKESQNRRNQGFSYYFCMMIEGSGSGSWRPKNTWIRIRIRIRIRNTGRYLKNMESFFNDVQYLCCQGLHWLLATRKDK